VPKGSAWAKGPTFGTHGGVPFFVGLRPFSGFANIELRSSMPSRNTTTTTVDAVDEDEQRSSIPLNQLPLVPPSTASGVPSKSIKPLIEHENISRDFALVLDAAQADIAANYPPQRYRLTTPVGYVHVASMRLLTSQVMVAAFNLRDAASRKRHIATERRAGRTFQPDFGLAKPDPRNGPGCVLELESREQLDYWVRWERQRLVDTSLRDWIAEDTVLEPILVQPVTFIEPNGKTIALVADDGSRRITNALDAMRAAIQVDPSLALMHSGDGPLRYMTEGDVKAVRRASLYPGTDAPSPLFPNSKRDEDVNDWLDGVAPQVAAFHRARTVQANVIVRFEPFVDAAGHPVGTITDAVDALLRQKHVLNASPKEWSRSDNYVLIGMRALARLEETITRNPITRRNEPVLDSVAAEVLSGQIPIEEAKRPNGSPRFRDPVHAVATLAAVLGAPLDGSPAKKTVQTTLNEWRQPASFKSRALIAADMAVHVVGTPENSVPQVVAALGGLFHGREFRTAVKLPDGRTWHDLLDEDPEVVRERAAEELGQGEEGPWSILLSLYGGISLIINPDAGSDGIRLTQSGLGRGNNNATPDSIVRTMVETRHGQALLADAVDQVGARLSTESRAPAVALTIQRDGEAPEPMSEQRVRELWNPNAPSTGTPSAGGSASPDRTTEFDLKCQALVRQGRILQQQVEELEQFADESGVVMVHARGIEPGFAAQLTDAAHKLLGFSAVGAQVWSARSSAAPSFASVEGESPASEGA
jgi:hypothetical protein